MGPYSPMCCSSPVDDRRLLLSLLININTFYSLFTLAMCRKTIFMIMLFIVLHISGIFHITISGITPENVVIHTWNTVLGEIIISNIKVHFSAHNRDKLILSTNL